MIMDELKEILDFNTEYKPLVRFGKEIPGYYVSKSGKVFSSKTNRFMSESVTLSKRSNRLEAVFFRASIKKNFFKDYKHTRGNDRDTWNCAKINIPFHRAVAETWIPIDDHPPEAIKSTWNDVPEEWRQWVRDTALIDHKDDNPRNNNVDNLRWTTPKENQHHRKKSNFENNL